MASHFNQFTDLPFIQYFETIVHFPMPDTNERLRIWKSSISSKAKLAPEVDLEEIAARFELNRTSILNVVRFASLEALRNGTNVISARAIMGGIKRELVKTGKVL